MPPGGGHVRRLPPSDQRVHPYDPAAAPTQRLLPEYLPPGALAPPPQYPAPRAQYPAPQAQYPVPPADFPPAAPAGRYPDSGGRFPDPSGPVAPAGPPAPRRGSGLGRRLAFGLVLVIGLAGLVAAAAGLAHAVLPRQFSAAQRHQIVSWELGSRWQTTPAGTIFPAQVSYTVPAGDLNSDSALVLQATRLTIGPARSCSAAFDAAAAQILRRAGCRAVLRATYLDSSSSMVTTVAIAVLPGGSQASTVARELGQPAAGQPSPGPVLALPVPGTAAAGFGDSERRMSAVASAGPYLVMSTAGFSTDRGQGLSSDRYVSGEMSALAAGVLRPAASVLGKAPPAPSCPGTPGC